MKPDRLLSRNGMGWSTTFVLLISCGFVEASSSTFSGRAVATTYSVTGGSEALASVIVAKEA